MTTAPHPPRPAAALALLALLLGACGQPAPLPSAGAMTPETPAAPEAAPPALSVTLSAGALVPPFSPEIHDYEVSAFSARQPGTVTVRGAASARLLGAELRDGEPYALPPTPISDQAALQLAVTRDGREESYTIHLRPADLPALTLRLDGPAAGDLLLSPFSSSQQAGAPAPFLLMVDGAGDVIYYRRLAAPGLDFKRHALPGGAVRHSYLSGGDAFLLDEQLRPLGQLRLLPTQGHPAYPADLHDFLVLGEDHFLLMAYVDKVVQNVPEALPHPAEGARVIAAFVQEVRDGQVLFEWDSSEHPELYALSSEGNDFSDPAAAADYAHLNSLALDPRDGGLLLSFRHLDAVLKVRRPDGAILWRLGGADDSFRTPAERRPSHQHFASLLGDGRLQLFDNGNARLESRVLTFTLDEAGGAIADSSAVPLGCYAFAMGSAQRLGDRLLVGLGAHGAGVPDVVELEEATGRRTLELTLPAGYYSYRALKFP